MVSASATEWAPVAEGDRARFREQADFGDLLAFEPLGQGRGGVDADLGVVARAAQDEVDHRGVVDRRIGVGTGDQRGHAARGGGGAGAGDGLAMLGPGSPTKARMSTRPGETTSPPQSTIRASAGNWSRVTFGADAGDDAVDDDEPAARLGLLNGIDETRVDESDRRS